MHSTDSRHVRWGIIGVGDVTEVKSGPAFSRVPGSSIAVVMRRDADKARDYADACVNRFDVRGADASTNARSLSGGNLQKFIVGREIMLKPEVMIVAQPTWGVDVGASAVLRQALLDLSRTGVAILVV